MGISVRPIDAVAHAQFLDGLAWASFLHTPQWFASKPAGTAEALGIYDGSELVGVCVFQYRTPVARLGWREVYLPHGPTVKWEQVSPRAVYDALAEYAHRQGTVRIRIEPVVNWRRWENGTIKDALATEGDLSFEDITPDSIAPAGQRVVDELAGTDWFIPVWASFSDAQPTCNFIVPLEGLSLDEVKANMNQMYRRNIKKSEKAGVTVREGGRELIEAFHKLHVASGLREGYASLPLQYFYTQFDAFDNDPNYVRVFLVELDGEPLAGGVWQKLNDHVWYTQGGSVETHREARAVNALQWAMIAASHAAGASRYDMGGIYPHVDDTSRGLLQFKVGTGGHLLQYPNERMKILRPAKSKAIDALMEGARKARQVKAKVRR